MQADILKSADPGFKPILATKLGQLGSDFWVLFDSFAYCIPRDMFLLSPIGFGEFTPEAVRKTFDKAHGMDDKVRLAYTGVTKSFDRFSLSEFDGPNGASVYFNSKLLKKFPLNCVVALRECDLDLGAKHYIGFVLDAATGLCYGAIAEFKIRDGK